MKKISLVFLLLFSLSLWADKVKYDVVKKDKKFYLESEKLSWEFSFQKRAPEIKKIEALDPQHDLVVYLSEEAGTQYTLVIYKAIIVDHKNKKVITTEPLDYQEVMKESGKVESEASYKIENNSVIWTFEEEKTVISF